MKLPSYLREALERRSPSFERQRIVLAALLQPPASLRGPHFHRWQPPPFERGNSPAGGLRRAVQNARED